MKTPTQYPILIFVLALLAGVQQLPAGILLSDNFDSNVLDTNQWTTNVSWGNLAGTPMVVVANQRCELTARGYLNTVPDFDPAAPGGIRITGTWTFVNDTGYNEDAPRVVTRSSGVPLAYYVGSGEVSDGINFFFGVLNPPGPSPLYITGNGGTQVTGVNVISNSLNLAQGDSANFTITDDGTNLTFYLTKVGDPTQTAFATAICTNHMSTNKVSFYNRESPNDTAAVDNIVVQTISPPAPSLAIAAVTNVSVLFWPATATNFVLQSATNVNSTNWTAVTDAVPVIAVTVSNQGPARFFRLQAQ